MSTRTQAVVMIAAVLGVVGCGAETPSPPADVATSPAARIFHSTVGGYSFEYPPGWQGGLPPAGPAQPHFFAPQAAADGYQPSIFIAVGELPESVDVQELERQREAQLAQNAEGYELLRRGATTLSGRPAAWIEYRVTAGSLHLRCRQVLVVRDSTSFSIVLNATDASFDDALAAERVIERTFRLEV
jgi:hypothetical protein